MSACHQLRQTFLMFYLSTPCLIITFFCFILRFNFQHSVPYSDEIFKRQSNGSLFIIYFQLFFSLKNLHWPHRKIGSWFGQCVDAYCLSWIGLFIIFTKWFCSSWIQVNFFLTILFCLLKQLRYRAQFFIGLIGNSSLN